MNVAAALVIAIVVQDPTPLRSLPRDSAPKLGMLASGQWLEVREEKAGYLKVWDHRHERPGYVRATQVRTYPMDETSAPALSAVIAFLKDTPGAEALGIGYVAAFLKAAPPPAVGPDVFDALGTFAERLARRASARQSRDETLAAHLAVAAEYGVAFQSYERADRTRVCADGEAFRRLLAMGGSPEQRARAALAVTQPECAGEQLPQAEWLALLEWRRDLLARVEPSAAPGHLANRLRMRRAAVESELAYLYGLRDAAKKAQAAAEEAVRQLALVERQEFGDGDDALYGEAALRVAASQWAAMPGGANGTLVARAGKQPGERCLVLDGGKPEQSLEHCTFAVPHLSSVRTAPDGKTVAIAVQTLAGWLELWVFRRDAQGWNLEPLPPAAASPQLGYVEFAGWSPDGERLLVVREARVDGRLTREFQIVGARNLEVQKRGGDFEGFGSFRRWHSAEWRGRTLALR